MRKNVSDMWQAVVRPVGIPEEWVIGVLYGESHVERYSEIVAYMLDMGIQEFEVMHYAPLRCTAVAIEDIFLN